MQREIDTSAHLFQRDTVRNESFQGQLSPKHQFCRSLLQVYRCTVRTEQGSFPHAYIGTRQFKAFLVEYPDIGLELIKSLIHRVRALTKTVGNLGLLDVYGRVARLLMDMAKDEGGMLVVAEPMTQQDMANRVGCSREMVSRILKDLRTGGYVRMDGPRLIITRKPPANW